VAATLPGRPVISIPAGVAGAPIAARPGGGLGDRGACRFGVRCRHFERTGRQCTFSHPVGSDAARWDTRAPVGKHPRDDAESAGASTAPIVPPGVPLAPLPIHLPPGVPVPGSAAAGVSQPPDTVVIVYGIPGAMQHEQVFNLFCLYGTCQVTKWLPRKEAEAVNAAPTKSCLVQMAHAAEASTAKGSLDGAELWVGADVFKLQIRASKANFIGVRGKTSGIGDEQARPSCIYFRHA
jgi:hypothetical protein